MVSGNADDGILLYSAGTSENLVQGNYAGITADGTAALPNGERGWSSTLGPTDNTIGGTAAEAGNVLSGNTWEGLTISDSATTGNLVLGNLIGTGPDGISPIPNETMGIWITGGASDNSIGGPTGGNTIANNSWQGIRIEGSSTGDAIQGNSIFSNGLLGIDLGGDGVTPNDPGDADTGPNDLQNFPVLVSAQTAGSTTSIVGTLNSTANTAFVIELFSGLAAGEARTSLGTVSVVTDGSGDASFAFARGHFGPRRPRGSLPPPPIPRTTPPNSPHPSRSPQRHCPRSRSATSRSPRATAAPPTPRSRSRSRPQAPTVTVQYATADGTATAGSDYTATSGTLTFAPSVTTMTINVPVIGDTIVEPDETFFINLSNPSNATIAVAQAQGTILNDDTAPTTLVVQSFTATPSGFLVTFNMPIDPTTLNVSTNPDSDVILSGPGGTQVPGSLVVDADAGQITFVATAHSLPTGTYNLTLVSGANAFHSATGDLLDGNADGTPGDDYTTTFDVTATDPVLSIANFARGAGQAVNLPANQSNGIPVTLSNGAGITSLTVTLTYDPALLTLPATNAVVLNVPGSVTADSSVPGSLIVTVSPDSPLPSGPLTLFHIVGATVPSTAPYKSLAVLDLVGVDATAGVTPVTVLDGDGVEVAAFVGDVSGDGSYSFTDYIQVNRLSLGLSATLIASAYPNLDPTIIADVNGDGSVGFTDAIQINRAALGLSAAFIPPIPAPPPTASGTQDPRCGCLP